ncbi:MAG: DUF368 domain-containing protein [Thermoplasmata archaeon]|nr:DUF368 domain-containing protein [Thermoplasmata archaeon]
MDFKKSGTIFLKGMAMGMADIVPGVSGGTVALITGIYERLVRAISQLSPAWMKHAVKGESESAKRLFWKADFELLVPLGFGIALAFLLMSNIMDYLLSHHTTEIYSFFFAIILASSALLFKGIRVKSAANIFLLFIGFFFAFLFVGMTSLTMGHELHIIFISGIIAVCAMILPGISGALILLFLNQYEYMLASLKNLVFEDIFAFLLGAVIGLLAFSRLLNIIIKKWRYQTISFLTGLMLGALRLPYKNIDLNADLTTSILLPAALGIILIYLLARFSKKAQKKKRPIINK